MSPALGKSKCYEKCNHKCDDASNDTCCKGCNNSSTLKPRRQSSHCHLKHCATKENEECKRKSSKKKTECNCLPRQECDFCAGKKQTHPPKFNGLKEIKCDKRPCDKNSWSRNLRDREKEMYIRKDRSCRSTDKSSNGGENCCGEMPRPLSPCCRSRKHPICASHCSEATACHKRPSRRHPVEVTYTEKETKPCKCSIDKPVYASNTVEEKVVPQHPVFAHYSTEETVTSKQPVLAHYSKEEPVTLTEPVFAHYSKEEPVTLKQPVFAHYSKEESITPKEPVFAHYSKEEPITPKEPVFSHYSKEEPITPKEPVFSHYSKEEPITPKEPIFAHYSKEEPITPTEPIFAHYSKEEPITPKEPVFSHYSKEEIMAPKSCSCEDKSHPICDKKTCGCQKGLISSSYWMQEDVLTSKAKLRCRCCANKRPKCKVNETKACDCATEMITSEKATSSSSDSKLQCACQEDSSKVECDHSADNECHCEDVDCSMSDTCACLSDEISDDDKDCKEWEYLKELVKSVACRKSDTEIVEKTIFKEPFSSHRKVLFMDEMNKQMIMAQKFLASFINYSGIVHCMKEAIHDMNQNLKDYYEKDWPEAKKWKCALNEMCSAWAIYERNCNNIFVKINCYLDSFEELADLFEKWIEARDRMKDEKCAVGCNESIKIETQFTSAKTHYELKPEVKYRYVNFNELDEKVEEKFCFIAASRVKFIEDTIGTHMKLLMCLFQQLQKTAFISHRIATRLPCCDPCIPIGCSVCPPKIKFSQCDCEERLVPTCCNPVSTSTCSKCR